MQTRDSIPWLDILDIQSRDIYVWLHDSKYVHADARNKSQATVCYCCYIDSVTIITNNVSTPLNIYMLNGCYG